MHAKELLRQGVNSGLNDVRRPTLVKFGSVFAERVNNMSNLDKFTAYLTHRTNLPLRTKKRCSKPDGSL